MDRPSRTRATGPRISIPRAAAALACVVLALLAGACGTTPATPAPAGGSTATSAPLAGRLDPVSSPDWEADMARFAAEDEAHAPPSEPVVFAGSSSFRMWDSLRADFPGTPVLNRGFGGSQVRDLAWHADPVAIRYRPRVVLLYAGENDIDAGRTPAQVLADTRLLVARLRTALPDTRILWVSIKPSPARFAQRPLQREANARVEAWLRDQPGTGYVDVATPMLDASGQPRSELFIADRLHMNARGYAIWRDAIAPLLR